MRQTGNWFKKPYRSSVNFKAMYLIARAQDLLFLRPEDRFKMMSAGRLVLFQQRYSMIRIYLPT
jgi:hypothetical protein